MNGVAQNTSTDEAATEFPQDDLEINALIHCAPTPPMCSYPTSPPYRIIAYLVGFMHIRKWALLADHTEVALFRRSK